MGQLKPGGRRGGVEPQDLGTWDDIADTPLSSYGTGNERTPARTARYRASPLVGGSRRRPVAAPHATNAPAPTLLQKIVGGMIVAAGLIVLIKLLLAVLGPGLAMLGFGTLCFYLLKPRG